MERYGRLTVLKDVERYGYRRRVQCQCDCGNIKNYYYASIKSNHTTSCGCLKKESKHLIKHSDSRIGKVTKEYVTWQNMKRRCDNPNKKCWMDYGGRGIKVCDRWINSYENFLLDMGRKPTPFHSIDRINVNGDYEPSNCKWSTKSEQQYNRRK
jgi:hypothetical protein